VSVSQDIGQGLQLEVEAADDVGPVDEAVPLGVEVRG
jgi:hypothetical protein